MLRLVKIRNYHVADMTVSKEACGPLFFALKLHRDELIALTVKLSVTSVSLRLVFCLARPHD